MIERIDPVLERITTEWVVAPSPKYSTPSRNSPVVTPVAAKKTLFESTSSRVVMI